MHFSCLADPSGYYGSSVKKLFNFFKKNVNIWWNQTFGFLTNLGSSFHQNHSPLEKNFVFFFSFESDIPNTMDHTKLAYALCDKNRQMSKEER